MRWGAGLVAGVVAMCPLAAVSASADETKPIGVPDFEAVGRFVEAEFGGFVYFGADDGVHGYELWRSDGTAAGTTMVTNDFPAWESDMRLYKSADRLFVRTRSQAVYAIDHAGRPERVTGFEPIVGSLDRGVAGVVGDQFVFTSRGGRLNVADPGSTVARPIGADARVWFNTSEDLAVTDEGWGYFAGQTTAEAEGQLPVIGVELFRTDGETVELVADLVPGDEGSAPQQFASAGGQVFFTAPHDGGKGGRELWVSDGTASGTHVVRDHTEGESTTYWHSFHPHGDAIFYAPLARELWRTDGTDGGTRLLMDVTSIDGATLMVLESVGEEVFFAIDFAERTGPGIATTQRTLLARTDGTYEGTEIIAKLPGSMYKIGPPAAASGRLYFSAPSEYGQVLWRSDGTAAGTFPVSRGAFDGPDGDGDPHVAEARSVGDRVLFSSTVRPVDGAQVNEARRLHVVDPSVPDPARRPLELPRIEGSPRPDAILTATPGRWNLAPTSFRYQWFRNGRPVPASLGGTEPTLSLRVQPRVRVGDQIHVVVTSSGIGAPAADARSAAVRVQPLPSTPLAGPVHVQGRTRVGGRLHATRPDTVRGTRLTYRWRVGGALVDGAVGPWLRLSPSMAGKRVRAIVIARLDGHDATRRASRLTKRIRA